jgi:eukaryotic-like serine/threonine-protein kinase
LITRKYRLWLLLAAALMITLVLSGCGGSRTATTVSSWPGLAASDDTVYMAFGPAIYSINPDSGTENWRYPAEPVRNQNFYAPPAVADDMIVADTYNGWVYALNLDGTEMWSFKDPEGARFVAGATIGDQIVYVGSAFGTMYALDRASGEELWHFSTDRDIWSAPLLVEDTLYFVTLDRHLYAVDSAEGDLLWQFPDDDVTPEESPIGPMVGAPILVDDTLFFGDFKNEAHALSLESQDLVWDYPTQNWIWGSLVYSEETETLIGADLDGNVFSIDAATGKEVWIFSEPTEPVVSSPVLFDYEENPAVFVTSGDSKLYILDLETGEKLNVVSVTAEFEQRFLFVQTGTDVRPVAVYAPPIIIDIAGEDESETKRLILLASHESPRPLVAYNRDTLEKAWEFDPTAE